MSRPQQILDLDPSDELVFKGDHHIYRFNQQHNTPLGKECTSKILYKLLTTFVECHKVYNIIYVCSIGYKVDVCPFEVYVCLCKRTIVNHK